MINIRINQSISQSINQSIDHSINYRIEQSINLPTVDLIKFTCLDRVLLKCTASDVPENGVPSRILHRDMLHTNHSRSTWGIYNVDLQNTRSGCENDGWSVWETSPLNFMESNLMHTPLLGRIKITSPVRMLAPTYLENSTSGKHHNWHLERRGHDNGRYRNENT